MVAFFFRDDKDDRLRTANAILVAILVQILQRQPEALVHFEPERKNGRFGQWNLHMLWRVFERIVRDNRIKRLCLVIDALGMLLLILHVERGLY